MKETLTYRLHFASVIDDTYFFEVGITWFNRRKTCGLAYYSQLLLTNNKTLA